MYGYSEKKFYIKKEDILSRVKQEDIVEMVFGKFPGEYNYVSSPFREDTNPGCYFEWYNGTLYFVDWGDPKRKSRDPFNVIEDYFDVSFYESLQLISSHFNLNLDTMVSKVSDNKPKVIVKQVKEPKGIEFKSRPFNNGSDRKFWSAYGISKADLMEDKVFPIIWYKIYSKKLKQYVVIRPSTRSYALTGFDDRAKIYTPDNSGKGKWATNCTVNDIGGLPVSSDGNTLVITKSYKDYRVLKNMGVTVIWLQNEGMIPDAEILIPIVSRFKRVVILFDNDNTGLSASVHVADFINDILPNRAFPLSIPLSLLDEGVTDPSDLYKTKGREHLLSFLTENQLINGEDTRDNS